MLEDLSSVDKSSSEVDSEGSYGRGSQFEPSLQGSPCCSGLPSMKVLRGSGFGCHGAAST